MYTKRTVCYFIKLKCLRSRKEGESQGMDSCVKKNEYYMKKALVLARKAFDLGEVPVGSIVVDSNEKIIGRGYNSVEKNKSQLAHAELLAISKAVKKRGDWRLDGCTLYVTLEPCGMCFHAIGLSRISCR